MSSSEEYLDSLLDSILSGGKADEEEKSVPEESQNVSGENRATDAGKAMSPDEIEEMLVSMGTLSGEEEETQEQSSEDDMEAMLAFMNEHNVDETDSDVLDNDSAASDDLMPDDLSLDDLSINEEDDSAVEAMDSDLSLDDLDMGESEHEELPMDGLSLDDSGAEEALDDEFALDDLSLDDLDVGESDPEDSVSDAMDDLSLDDLDMGESDPEESGLEENSSEENVSEEPSIDELSLDELSLDDLEQTEEADDGASDDFTIEELSLDDLPLEETEETEGGMDAMDDLSLDDVSLEEPENIEEEADGLMSEEDIDRLLSGDMPAEEETAQDFALEETEGGEDDDLSALLAGMNHDEDLAEINDLLEESDQDMSADDDMLAMLEGVDQDGSFDLFESDEAAKEAEGIRELSPEEVAEREGSDGQDKKEKKKRKKLFGKKKKGGEAGAEDELDALLGEMESPGEEKEEKKPGFFARLLNFLLESDEDDEDPLAAEILAGNDGETGTVSDENKELLQELSDEDKKGKKKKKKKDKKGKKGKEEEEDGKKAKKPKKEKTKKEKKKKEEEVDLFAPPEKKLSKKKVITVFLFCGTIAAGIIVFSMILPDTMQKRDAYTAYDQGEYTQVYDLLYGKELSEEDEVIFQGSNLILQMNRKLSSYENYVNLDMRLEALNALITGVEKYQQILPEAENYNVVAEVNDIYSQILERLSANFGLSEGDAWDILSSEDDETYTRRLQAVIDGESYGVDETEEAGETTQDILPEEEEIIERIGGIDGETEIVTEPWPEADVSAQEASDEQAQDESVPDEQAQDENTDEGTE